MKTQVEFLQEILDLKKKHQSYDIHFFVDQDDFCDDWRWAKHKITSVEICPWYECNYGIYTSNDGIREYIENENYDPKLSPDDFERLIERKIDELDIKNAICVFTAAG